MKRNVFFVVTAVVLSLGLPACNQAETEPVQEAPLESPAPLSVEIKAELDKKTGLELVHYLKSSPQSEGFAYADKRLSAMLSPGMEDKELLTAAKTLDANGSTSGRKALSLR